MPNTIQASPLFLSGNVALDFINTQYSENGIDKDVLANNQSVISWLEQVGQLKESPNVIPIDLMVISKQLRTKLKNIIDQLLNGQPPKLSAFNHLLDEVQFLEQLDWDNDKKKFILLKKCRVKSSLSILEPVISSMLYLLTHENMQYIRQCEASDCVLYFLDLTKSHRRRWCSMSTCGNRMKVAAFRERKKKQ